MSYSFIFQLKEFLIFFTLGILLGIFYGILNIHKIFKHRQIYQISSDIIFALFFTISYLYTSIKVNSLNIRFFLIVAYLLGFCIERRNGSNLSIARG